MVGAGVLLHGPPGCAKTTIARAIAGSGGYAFVSLSGAQVSGWWSREVAPGLENLS